MAGYQIPLSYFVSVSAIEPARGVEPKQLSTILILTDEQPIVPVTSSYTISRTARGIEEIYGTNAETTKQAQIIFSQTPNILANNGYVIAASCLQNVTIVTQPATSGTLTTENLTDNLSNFGAVTNGDLTITVDSQAHVLTGLDFTDADSLASIAGVLKEALNGICDVTLGSSDNIVFTSLTTGTSSTVAVSATSGGTGTDLYGATLLNGEDATAVTGTNATTTTGREPLKQAISRIAGEIYFEGILTTRDVADAEMQEASAYVQAMGDRILANPQSNISAIAGIFTTLESNFNTKSLLYTFGDDTASKKLNARLFAAAYLSRGLAVNYEGSNTVLTMNLKDLVGIQADTNISETILSQCESVGADCYVSVAGIPKVVSNRQDTHYFDQIVNVIWLADSVQVASFNTLAQSQTRIPQTEAGMQTLVNAVRGRLKQAVRNGMVAPNAWGYGDRFGDFEDFNRNIEEYGYYIYYTPVAEQAIAEREQRKAPVIQVAAKEAGAIHSSNIIITLAP